MSTVVISDLTTVAMFSVGTVAKCHPEQRHPQPGYSGHVPHDHCSQVQRGNRRQVPRGNSAIRNLGTVVTSNLTTVVMPPARIKTRNALLWKHRMIDKAVALWAKRRPGAQRAWTSFSRIAALFLAFYLFVTLTPVLRPWVFWLSTPWGGEVPETVLVLGGDEQAPGLVGYSTYIRLHYAAKFWRTGKIKRFVLSGGATGGRPLAEAMAEFLRGYGVPPEAIVLEGRSQSTWENIVNSKPLLDALQGRKAVLTSDYHMRRVMAVCRAQGLRIEPLTVPEGEKRLQSPLQRWPLLLTLGTETGKIVWYWALGRF